MTHPNCPYVRKNPDARRVPMSGRVTIEWRVLR